MNTKFHLHDVVALLEDLPAKHFETDQPLLLHRGQIGTIVMIYDARWTDLCPAPRPGRSADAVAGCARIRDGLMVIEPG